MVQDDGFAIARRACPGPLWADFPASLRKFSDRINDLISIVVSVIVAPKHCGDSPRCIGQRRWSTPDGESFHPRNCTNKCGHT